MGNPFGKLKSERNIPHESLDLKQTPQLDNLDLNDDDDDDDEDLRARVLDDGEFFDDPLETKLIEDALVNIYSSNDDETTHVRFELTAGESSSSSKKNPSKQQEEDSGFLKYQCKPFLGQKIEEIRAKASSGGQFIDPYFKPNIKLITESCRTELFKSLANTLRVANKFDMNELAQRIVWKKSKIITYKRRIGRDEFVLDARGQPLATRASSNQYTQLFSVEDIFQGTLGDCFMIAAIMGITYNKRLLAFLMPIDNALRPNMAHGVYHFRLWKLGQWYDVVVDDYLPADAQFNLIFTKNVTFGNEFWIALLEKAVAKFLGRYDILNGGNMENAALFFSGGIQDVYCTDIAKHLSNPHTAFRSAFARQTFMYLQSEHKRVETILPNVDELFTIITCAVKRQDLVGAFTTYPNAEQIGIYREHQYALTDALVVKKMKIVKIHNPHNTPDRIKGTPAYKSFEKSLTAMGVKPAEKGEFYMQYSDFVNCFETICLFNLIPDSPVAFRYPNLVRKSTIFTEWKIVNIRGSISSQATSNSRPFAIELSLGSSQSSEYVIITCVQNYSKNIFLINLNLYKASSQGNNGTFLKKYRSSSYAIQQLFYLNIPSGRYICIFETDKPVQQQTVCARVFINKKSANSVKVKSVQ